MEDLKWLPAEQLPGGYKQRLAMAAALMHEPDILFLDEPTSGVDPLARREFWQRITALAEQGVTVIVTTHFMEEAEYCDRVVIMDAGRVLAQGTPAEIRSHARSSPDHEPTMEDAFIAIVEESRQSGQNDNVPRESPGEWKLSAPPAWLPGPARRVWSLGPQGGAANGPRRQQRGDRHRAAGAVDPGVRLRSVARRARRARGRGDRGAIARRHRPGGRVSAVAVF